MAGAVSSRKNLDATVFVRWKGQKSIERHHLEDLFSQVGPIKKSSVIKKGATAAASYGFIKYTTHQDAVEACRQFDQYELKLNDDKEMIPLQVVLAADTKPTKQEASGSKVISSKRNCRLIVRNLSFYAKERHIRTAFEPFGEIVELHIPKVKDQQHQQHRGFCFVQYAHPHQAKQALEHDKPIVIQKRPVHVQYSLNKTAYEHQQRIAREIRQSQQTTNQEEMRQELEQNEDDKDDKSEDRQSDDSTHDNEEDSSDDDDDSNEEEDLENESQTQKHNMDDLEQGRTLFVRNLPFDATRHDLFQLFSKYGYIQSIYLVHDKKTGMAKGTAFVTFRKNHRAEQVQSETLTLKDRTLKLDLAVKRETANSLFSANDKEASGKDRRHLYLQMEGYIENMNEIPVKDQEKRQHALRDKKTKLKSPLFVIHPCRLSLRNLDKSLTTQELNTLLMKATVRGLSKVSPKDQMRHWKALGQWTMRELLERPNTIPPVDAGSITSVFIDKDESRGTSRGFGFCTFQHHVHALACLRELNNNTKYAEFAAGGRHALRPKSKSKPTKDAMSLIPRLIVEFAVENKAKAKKQEEHREAQRANALKQRMESRQAKKNEKKKKKSRGARQRERKRKDREEGHEQSEELETAASPPSPQEEEPPEPKRQKKTKAVKPPKKRKVDPEEEKFTKMVETYKASIADSSPQPNAKNTKANKKRWFE